MKEFNHSSLAIQTLFHVPVQVIFYFYCFLSQLFEIIYREEMLQSVINSVTRNILSIFLTANLAIILIYLFSIIGYAIFNDDFMVETHPKTLVSTQCKQKNNYETYMYMYCKSGFILVHALYMYMYIMLYTYMYYMYTVVLEFRLCNKIVYIIMYMYSCQLSTFSAVNIQQLKFYYHCFS